MRTLTCSSLLAVAMLATVVAGPGFAVDLWYSFEGDSGDTVTDKLTADGTQNGFLIGNTSIQTEPPGYAAWGAQSALFATPVDPGWNEIEIPGSTALGEDYSLAIYAKIDPVQFTKGLMRLFSSYNGTGAVPITGILFDMDPYGAEVATMGVRAAVRGVSVATAAVPAAMSVPGYHHYALTVDSGLVNVYLDGSVVATGNVALGYSNTTANLRIGEDTTGTSCEQFVGNIDEVVVVNQALTAGQVASLAAGNAASSVITPIGYSVYYNFEGDSGTTITDKFTADGIQNGIVQNNVRVDTLAGNAKVGSGSATIGPMERFSEINTGVRGTALGSAFTLSAVVNVDSDGYSGNKLTRLFSNWVGRVETPTAPYLIMDFEPDGSSYGYGLRLTMPDGTIVTAAGAIFSYSADHTLTATYDNGAIKLYIDGVQVATGTSTGGVVNLGNYSLLIGEDQERTVTEQYRGDMDDVLILGRALSGAEVAQLHAGGVSALIPEPGVIALLVTGLAGVLAWWRRR